MAGHIAVRYDPMKMAGLALLTLLLTAGTVFGAIKFYNRGETGSFRFFALCVGCVVLPVGVGLLLRKAFDRSIVIDISDEGMLVPATSPERIGWRDVEAVRLHKMKRQPFIELVLNAQAGKTFPLTKAALRSLAGSRRLGMVGLGIPVVGLDRSAEELIGLIRPRFLRVHAPEQFQQETGPDKVFEGLRI